jgi:hypothetical protein
VRGPGAAVVAGLAVTAGLSSGSAAVVSPDVSGALAVLPVVCPSLAPRRSNRVNLLPTYSYRDLEDTARTAAANASPRSA